MIPYEELVAALDRYVARNGGTPSSVHAPAGYGAPSHEMPSYEAAPSHEEPGTHETAMPPLGYDEPHDPDLAPPAHAHADEDATHVGAMPGAAPAKIQSEEPSNEIDLGDVLSDDEL